MVVVPAWAIPQRPIDRLVLDELNRVMENYKRDLKANSPRIIRNIRPDRDTPLTQLS